MKLSPKHLGQECVETPNMLSAQEDLPQAQESVTSVMDEQALPQAPGKSLMSKLMAHPQCQDHNKAYAPIMSQRHIEVGSFQKDEPSGSLLLEHPK